VNKKMILLLTGLILVSPALHIAASAETMYRDIKTIVEDRLTGKSDRERLENVQKVLTDVKYYKAEMQRNIVSLHSRINNDRFPALILGAMSSVFFGVSALSYYLNNITDVAPFAAFGFMSATGTLFGMCQRKATIYYAKKKIVELNKVIIKLEAMEKVLQNKVYPRCMYCNPDSDTISPMATEPAYMYNCNNCQVNEQIFDKYE
jgi:hypothetical protein